MPKSLFFIILSLSPAVAGAQAGLTETELRWLRAGEAVVAYAKAQALPIDIIVQPQAGPNDVPVAMGFDAGRCKLVLSLRGNPKAEAILAPVAAARRPLMIEAMMAHEIGHCWRYAHGDWHALPAGFVKAERSAVADPALRQAEAELLATRREEAYSDLVALAWVRLRHAEAYAQVYAWMAALRQQGGNAGGSHDTQDWLRLAANPAVFGVTGTPFEQGRAVWRQGLIGDE